MSERFLSFNIALVWAIITCASAAQAQEWTLVQTVGEVTAERSPSQKIALSEKQTIPASSTVRTGRDGRAILLRGQTTIVMSPMSQLVLPGDGDTAISSVRQVTGKLLFNVSKKPTAHFQVDTPFLAAVVKGTVFSVTVNASGASVHVREGAVEVLNAARSASSITRAGQISSVFVGALADIFTTGVAPVSRSRDDIWSEPAPEFEPRTLETESHGSSTKRPLLRASFQPSTARRPGTWDQKRNVDSVKRDRVLATVKATAGEDIKNDKIREAIKADGEAVLADAQTAQGVHSSKGGRHSGPWFVIQASGSITLDGNPYSISGLGLVRSLPPGSAIATGADGRIVLERGQSQFTVQPNSVVVLPGDADTAELTAIQGRVERQSVQDAAKSNTAARKTSAQTAFEMPKRGEGEAAPSGFDITGKSTVLPKPSPKKTQEARTQVIGSVTLILYGLTAAILLYAGTRLYLHRSRRKAAAMEESPIAVRMRNIVAS